MPIETVRDWDAKHGEYVHYGKTWLLFQDGAMRSNTRDGCQLVDPPDVPLSRAKLLLQFHQIKLQSLVDEFDRYKSALLGTGKQGGFLPLRSEKEHLRHLDQLKAGVDREKVELEDAQQELNELLENDPLEQQRRRITQTNHHLMEHANNFARQVRAREV